LDWVTNITVIALIIVCSLLAVRVCKKYDIRSFVRRIFFPIFLPHMHEYVAKKWIDTPVHAKFTNGALEFIKAKCAKEFSLLIVLSYRYVRGRVGGVFLPYAEIRLGVGNPSDDIVEVESNATISVLVARQIYEVLKQEKIPLIVTTSGFWKFKKLRLRQDLSWFLHKQETRRKAKRHFLVGPHEMS